MHFLRLIEVDEGAQPHADAAGAGGASAETAPRLTGVRFIKCRGSTGSCGPHSSEVPIRCCHEGDAGEPDLHLAKSSIRARSNLLASMFAPVRSVPISEMGS